MYGLRTAVHLFHGVRGSSVSRYFVGVNCLPMKLLLVWVDRSLICVNVGGLWRACSSLCSCSVCVVSSVMELLSSICAWAHVLLSPTVSFLFAFHWLMRWAFLFLVEGERCIFFWAWLVASPVFSTGLSALIHISLTDIALELTWRSQVNFFHLSLRAWEVLPIQQVSPLLSSFVDSCSL